jgi:hypothetical protein
VIVSALWLRTHRSPVREADASTTTRKKRHTWSAVIRCLLFYDKRQLSGFGLKSVTFVSCFAERGSIVKV